MPVNPNAMQVLEARYLQKNPVTGEILETPDDMFRRVAKHLASVEAPDQQAAYEKRFYAMMSSLDFLPNSPTLMNAGTGHGNLAACFVIPIPDTMEGIAEAATASMMVQKFGGGTGFSGSSLRAKGTPITTTQGVACGALRVLDLLNEASVLVTQGGKREGANMFVLRWDHPEVLDFIHHKDNVSRCVGCKQLGLFDKADGKLHHVRPGDDDTHEFVEDKTAANFNVSVGVDADFFELVDQGDPENGGDDDSTFRPVNRKGTVNEARSDEWISARSMWQQMIHSAWSNGDPGMLMLDTANHSRSNPVPSLGPLDTTNPCGEQWLYHWDACTLGSINMMNFVIGTPDYFVDADRKFEDCIDWDRLAEIVELSIRMLDNVITVNEYPLSDIERVVTSIRRIGEGVMGFGDMLFALRIPYDSPDALDLAKRLGYFINDYAWQTSRDLAEERGAFPMWEESIYNGAGFGITDPVPDWINRAVPPEWRNIPVRHSARTCIAPTGTISVIAGVSSGIEPLFQLAFKRRHKIAINIETGAHDWVEMKEANPQFESALREWLEESADRGGRPGDLRDTDDIIFAVIESLVDGMTLAEANRQHGLDLPQWMLDVFMTSKELPYEAHIRMQAVWQHNVDNAVSKTINFPNSATEADFDNAYHMARALGCQGITCYRDGSRSVQVLGNTNITGTVDGNDASMPGTVSIPVGWVGPVIEEPAVPALPVSGEVIQHEPTRALRKKLSDTRPAFNHKFTIGGQEGYLSIGLYDDGCPGEVFLILGKDGSTLQGLAHWAGLMTSMLLQYGAELPDVAEKLIGTRFEPSGRTNNNDIPWAMSIPDYVMRYLMTRFGHLYGTMREHVEAGEHPAPVIETREMGDPIADVIELVAPVAIRSMTEYAHSVMSDGAHAALAGIAVDSGITCDVCGGLMRHASGCLECVDCGNSKCN